MSIIFKDSKSLTHEELEKGSELAPKFDANGLVTAITVEAGTKDILMLAHMNAAAIALTLETGDAHYYSRSRKKIWKKGESSGEIQKLVEMRIDCDQDAIIVVVEQTGRGAACHTGKKSCFYRSVEMQDGTARLVENDTPQVFDPNEVYGG